jgi:hypothetical protein
MMGGVWLIYVVVCFYWDLQVRMNVVKYIL